MVRVKKRHLPNPAPATNSKAENQLVFSFFFIFAARINIFEL